MLIQTLILSLFSITAIQAKSKQALHQPGKLPCVLKLESYRGITEHIKNKTDFLFEEFEGKKFDARFLKQLKKYHDEFAHQISDVLAQYDGLIPTIPLITNSEERLKICRKNLAYMGKKNQELIKHAKDMKDFVLGALFLEKTIAKSDAFTNKIEKQIFRIVNLIIVVDLSYKIGKGAFNLWKWATRVQEGIPSEEALLTDADVGEFAERLDEVIADELGPEEIGAEASEALRGGVSEFLGSAEVATTTAAGAEVSTAVAETAESIAVAGETAESIAVAGETVGAVAELTALAEGTAVVGVEAAALAGASALAAPIAIGVIGGVLLAQVAIKAANNLKRDIAYGNCPKCGLATNILHLVANIFS